jgi:hypothetical protein
VSRHEFYDAFHQGERTGNVVQTEKAVKTREANTAAYRGVQENTLKLGAEIDFAALKAVIKRLDAHAVPREDEATF